MCGIWVFILESYSTEIETEMAVTLCDLIYEEMSSVLSFVMYNFTETFQS